MWWLLNFLWILTPFYAVRGYFNKFKLSSIIIKISFVKKTSILTKFDHFIDSFLLIGDSVKSRRWKNLLSLWMDWIQDILIDYWVGNNFKVLFRFRWWYSIIFKMRFAIGRQIGIISMDINLFLRKRDSIRSIWSIYRIVKMKF